MRRLVVALALLTVLVAPLGARKFPHRGTGVVPPGDPGIPIQLDSTAHGSSGSTMLCTFKPSGTTWQTASLPSFATSTVSGRQGQLLVAAVGGDSSTAVMGGSLNATGLTFTKRAGQTTGGTGTDWGSAIYTAFSSTGGLSAVTVIYTAPSSASGQPLSLCIFVIDGVKSTEVASFGALADFIDASGTANTRAAQLTLTTAGAGSILIGTFNDTQSATALVADSSTTPWDLGAAGTSAYFAIGRYKAASVTGTPGSYTFGSVSLGANFVFQAHAAIEVLQGP